MDALLISLHSRHAQNVFDRKKSIELRKRSPRLGKQFKINPPDSTSFLPAFDFVLIYETAPVAEIIGYCTAFEIVAQSPDKWVRDYQSSLCLTAKEIYDYLGDRAGYGIKLRKQQRIAPIPLSRMRELGIVPPQGYRYLSEKQISKLGIKF